MHILYQSKHIMLFIMKMNYKWMIKERKDVDIKYYFGWEEAKERGRVYDLLARGPTSICTPNIPVHCIQRLA